MRSSIFFICAAVSLLAIPAHAQKKYDPGATDTEIKIGQTMPYSGPASQYSISGQVALGYFKMLNETRGGINGRKVTLISVDDGYSPPKTVEVTRKLVESDQVLALMNSLGTGPQVAVQKYLNAKKVPQVLVFGLAPVLMDAKVSPWTIAWGMSYEREGALYGKYLATTKPNAKIGVLYQNDDLGKSLLHGLQQGLGAKAANIVKEVSHEVTDPTVEPQILQLNAAGVDTVVVFSTNKAQAQAIRKVATLGWKPTYILPLNSASISNALEPAGLENARGVISGQWFKSPGDPLWANDAGAREYSAFMRKYVPNVNADDNNTIYSYLGVQLAAMALERCKDNLTRENLLKQVQGLSGVEMGMLLPGIKVNYTADDYNAIRQMGMAQFDGKSWKPLSDPITVDR